MICSNEGILCLKEMYFTRETEENVGNGLYVPSRADEVYMYVCYCNSMLL